MKTIIKLLSVFLFTLAINAYGQDPEGLYVRPAHGQSAAEVNHDKDQCYAYAESYYNDKNHRTLKRTGIGAGAGAVAGAILGKPLAGAAIGGAAGGVSGHRKGNKEERAFNEDYASCLRDKGYNVDIDY